jgi:hypothetical protein
MGTLDTIVLISKSNYGRRLLNGNPVRFDNCKHTELIREGLNNHFIIIIIIIVVVVVVVVVAL